MKIQFVIACFLVSVLPFRGYSQHATIGIQGGLVISSVHVNPISVLYGTTAKIKSKPGPMIGALVNIPIAKGLSVEPGIFYCQKGFKLADNYLSVAYEARYRFNYIEIPLFCKYSFKGLYLGVGPYVGIATSAVTKIITVDTSATIKRYVGNDDTDAIKRMDAGVVIKTGYVTSFGFFASVQYGLGLANVLPGNLPGVSIKNNLFSISIGYYFGMRSKHLVVVNK
ncbi:MAG: hypothetical protein BGO70_01160 [Bacteroidetes bacterium 43-93]|uniref:porin family protein n=1 Tax=uncultured Dysgonomonas sp. TaxID=206096 RepID=UPI00092A146D|nr:porin family protein [uncultured Dysgonomonas sp.]MBN9483114.1 PorT family protein [Bacteroidota bacterium]OJW96321.1 MAG: hypothetical protein BGO70_01160 [Bacteroidetes bacterium 43-93]